jgi:AcrR family transcriptional regulator
MASTRDPSTAGAGEAPAKAGRKPDPSKDAALLDAAIEIVAEVGYDGMTMDLVAARAGSTKSALYRRWSSKGDLTLAAVARMQQAEIDLATLPDTGTLRGDLLALTQHYGSDEGQLKLRMMAGLSSLLERDPGLVDAAHSVITEPWVEVCRLMIQRAVDRGEAETDDVETVARVVPSMTSDRVLVRRQPVDRDFFVGLIDAVVLPAVRRRPSA